MNRTTFSAARLGLIAQNTLRETMRQRFFPLLLLVAAALGLAAWWLRDCSLGAPRTKFLLDSGFAGLSFFGAVIAIVISAQSFAGEIERRTVHVVLARPVSRTEFVLGKLAGVLGLLLVFIAAGTGLLVGLASWQETGTEALSAGMPGGGGAPSGPAIIGCGLVQLLRSGVLAALTLLVASFARGSLFAVMSGFAALTICSLQSVARDACQVAGSEWAKGVVGAVAFILPDFGLYDVADGVAAGGALSPAYLAGITLYSMVYMAWFGGLSVFCFRHREL